MEGSSLGVLSQIYEVRVPVGSDAMVPKRLLHHSVIHTWTLPSKSMSQLGESDVGTLCLSLGGVLVLAGSISCSRAWISRKFHGCETMSRLCHSVSHSWASPTWPGFLPTVWRGVTIFLVVEGLFLGCSVFHLRWEDISLGATYQYCKSGFFLDCSLSERGENFLWMFYRNLRLALLWQLSLSCGKSHISGHFLLVLERDASSSLLCISSSVRRYSLGSSASALGAPFQLWRATSFGGSMSV